MYNISRPLEGIFGTFGSLSGHGRETWARYQGFLGCMHNMSLSLDIDDDGTVFVWDNVFIACVVYLSEPFFAGPLYSAFGLLSLPGYRGYLKVVQPVLQTLLLFAESLLCMCVIAVRRKQITQSPDFLFQNTNQRFLNLEKKKRKRQIK